MLQVIGMATIWAHIELYQIVAPLVTHLIMVVGTYHERVQLTMCKLTTTARLNRNSILLVDLDLNMSHIFARLRFIDSWMIKTLHL